MVLSNYWKKKLEELNQSQSNSSKTAGSNYWQSKMDELEEEEKKKKSTITYPTKEDFAEVTSTYTKKDEEDKPWYKSGVFEDGYQFGDVTKFILGVDDKKTRSRFTGVIEDKDDAEQMLSTMTSTEIKNTSNTLYYDDLAIQKQVAEIEEKLSKVTLDNGTTLLEEAHAVASMEDGKEKKARKEELEKKMLKANVNPDMWYSMLTGDKNITWTTAKKFAGAAVNKGLGSFNTALTGFLDLTAGNILKGVGWENNPISKLDDYYENLHTNASYDLEIAKARMGAGGWADGVGNLTESTVAALPQAILAIATAGGSAATSLSTTAAQASGTILQNAGITVQQMLKNPQFWTSFVTTYANDYEDAKNNGADDLTAGFSATITSMMNAGVEIGGGIQVLPDKLAGKGNKAITEWVKSTLEEGGEEVVQGVISDSIAKGLYDSDREIVEPGEMLQEFGMGMGVGGVLGGGQVAAQSTINAATNAVAEHKANQLTENEQKVLDKEVENRIAEAEEDGTKLTQSEKKKIYNSVREDLEKGFISTDTIESVLGGDSYKAYKESVDSENSLVEQEKALAEEYKELNKKVWQEMTGEEHDRREELRSLLPELRAKIKANEDSGNSSQLKYKLSQDVSKLVQNDRLVESYNEKARRGQAFEADLTKYDAKQQAVIQKAVDSGILNNTRRTHDFVDMVAKISADKGVLFDFTDNAKLKESSFAVDGAQVNGYFDKSSGTIGINIDSAKALNTVVGHEVTHVLEGTDFYNTFRDTIVEYAKAKGDYQSRIDTLNKLYKAEDVDSELVADLAGDYLFTDSDFIRKLSTENRNIFQKIYDEVKYLCKVATAGSKEARQLEKVKKAFEDAYRAENVDSNSNTEVKNSLSDSDGKELSKGQQEYFKDSKMRDENGNLKVMYHGSQDAGFHTFDAKMSDDGTSFFFVDRNDVAASYSGTTETYEAKAFKTAEDANKFFESIGKPEYEVIEKDGKYRLREDEGSAYYTVAESESLEEIYQEFCDYEGVGYGDANYKVYLNLTNPLEVDAEGRNWNNISREYSQEVYDRYKSLTDSEKTALSEIAGWDEYGIFKDEILSMARAKSNGKYYDADLASAYEKLGGANANLYDAFTIASDNFSEESLKEFAVKQMNTRDYAQRAKEQGYDGVIFKNIHDNGGYSNGSEGASTVAIAFDSNQIKSVANTEPTGNPDIRYSLSDEVTEEQNKHGLDVKGEVSFSLSNDTAYMDKAISKNESSLKVDKDVLNTAKALRKRIATRMNDIKDRGLVAIPEDIEGNTYIANSSYDGTEENTTICPRSLASEAFVDAVSEYLGRPLSVEEQIYISQDLQGRSLTPECTYCYVATDRKAYRAFLGDYISQRDAVLQKVKDNPNADVSRNGDLYKEFLNGRKDTNPMYSRFKMWVDSYKNGTPMIEASHLANVSKLMGDINSEFGAELKPQIVDAMKYAQSASWAKKRVNYVAYNGHILNWNQDRINKLNSHYGLRMYSFSDFHPAFVLENMQMITDASVRGLKMLGYTKDTDFVEIFAPSGMNINVSTFGFETGGNVYENNIIGAEWEKAKALREQYPNVGITFVATNDTLVNWALEQDWIDVVIPHHLVRTGAEVAKAFGYTNYTSESSDTKDVGWSKGADKKYIAPTEHNNDKATYLDALAKNHLKPRFVRFLNNPNYMKLVNECRQPASESKPVQPVFNEDAAMTALAKLEANGFYQPIGGSVERMYEIAAEVAENMEQELAPAMSLSWEGETPKSRGTYNVYGKDVSLPKKAAETAKTEQNVPKAEDVAPVVEETEMFPNDLAPVEAELEKLYEEQEWLYRELENALDTGSADKVERLAGEYDALSARIRELEAEDSERVNSLTDADAPAEIERQYDTQEDITPISKKDIAGIAREAKTTLALKSEQMGDFRKLIEEYSNSESPSREQLFKDIRDNFGTYTERIFDETISDAKNGLYPQLFPDNIINPTDQLLQMVDVANMSSTTRTEMPIDDNTLWEVANDIADDVANMKRLQQEVDANTHASEAFDSLMQTADQYAPVAEETTVTAPVAEKHEAIKPKTENTVTAKKAEPKESHTAKVLTEAPETETKQSWRSKVNNLVLDKGMIFEDLSLATGNREIQAKWNSIRNAESKAQTLIGEGSGNVSSLMSIRDGIANTGKTEQFYNYLYHQLNVDRMTLEERYKDTPNKTVFGDEVTADVSRKAAAELENANPEFKQYAEEVYGYMTHLREMLVENGVISKETADLWAEMYPHYVPIRRVGDDGLNINVPLDTGKTGVNAPVKKATGGNRDIMPLFDTMAQRTIQTYKAIAKNRFGVELKNTLGTTISGGQMTMDEILDGVDNHEELLQKGKDGQKPTFTVFENGERVTFEITEEMYDAMKPADGVLGSTNKTLNTISNIRRGTLTEYNPWFMLKNAVKDVQDILINSQHPVQTYAAIPKAIQQMINNGYYYAEYLANGGGHSAYFENQSTYFDSQTNTFQEKNKALETAKKVTGLNAIAKANDVVEMLPRLAEYIASREAKRSVDVAMLDAARVTTNFAAGGDLTKLLNRNGFTFLNASVQGAIQQVRNVREAKANGVKGVVGLAAKYLAAGLPALILNNLIWDDDEEYEELSDYVKDNYYIVGKYGDGKFVRIPKGRMVAVIQNGFEQMENLVTGNDEVDLARFLDLAMTNLAPNNPLDNNILSPIIDVARNETWYGEDLVPTRLQDLPAAEQYDESTDSISKWLGEKTAGWHIGDISLEISPVKANYLIDQYSGILGDTFLPMLTPEAESGDDSFAGNMIAPLKDAFTTDSVMKNQNVSDFYSKVDELTTNAKASGATDDDILYSKYMNSISSELGKLYGEKRKLQNSDLADDEKYEQVRNIQQQIVDLAKEGLSNYENIRYEGDGEYAIIGDKYFQWYTPEEGDPYWRKLTETQVTKYNLTKNAGNAHYVTDGNVHYRLDEDGEWTKISDKQLERQNEVTKALGITPEEYWSETDISFLPMSDGEYEYAFDNPENYAIAKAVGGYDSFKTYSNELYNIKADKDASGKSISGSRKEKVLDYINNLDIDYGEKIILFKNEYNADDTYNREIVEYLDSRDDISWEEMQTILKKLGFTVYSDGRIEW